MTDWLGKNRLAAVGLVIVILLVVAALVGPWISPYDPAEQDLPARLTGPSATHPFGTDELGRDILSRVLVGTRVSLRVGATVVLVSSLVGVAIGGAAGFIGGRFDTFINVFVINSLMAFRASCSPSAWWRSWVSASTTSSRRCRSSAGVG